MHTQNLLFNGGRAIVVGSVVQMYAIGNFDMTPTAGAIPGFFNSRFA